MVKLKKTFVFGENKKLIEREVKKLGFLIDRKKPDFIISYGGDGTFLKSEYLYPGVPKLILRNSQICKLCFEVENEVVLRKIKSGDFYFEKFSKLEANFKEKKILAANEIVVKNKLPQHCIRYNIFINEKKLKDEIIGDGIVVATVLGSTGYYRSITDSYFETGIGLAFNNSTEQIDHIVLKEDKKIKIKILRGPAILYADNQEKILDLKVGDEVLIYKSKKYFKLIKIKL